jgi:hypothetical protein
MMMTTRSKLATLTVALAALAAACADPMTSSRSGLIPGNISNTVTFELFDFPSPGFPADVGDGGILLCKQVKDLDPGGTFNFTITTLGTGDLPDATPTLVVPAGGKTCVKVYKSNVFNVDVEQVVITEDAPPAGWTLDGIDTKQLLATGIYNNGAYTPPRLDDAENVATRTATLYINNDMARIVTFTNTFAESPPPPPPPPPPICDFITFGRLVIEVGDQKVVISGNAGGNKPGGGILGEFHIEANGVDNHVADISTYAAISSGPLSGLTNSRIVTGTAKNGVVVELRLWDGGEPGAGTDFVYVKLDNTELLGAAGEFIDIGNMQFHPVCRGPD